LNKQRRSCRSGSRAAFDQAASSHGTSSGSSLRLGNGVGIERFSASLRPKAAEPWSLTSLRENLIKIGAKVISHGRYVTFQMAEVAVSRLLFRDILMLIARLRAPPEPA